MISMRHLLMSSSVKTSPRMMRSRRKVSSYSRDRFRRWLPFAAFSALGFYPVCPASDEYAAGSPLFKKATIRLENGKTVEIEAPENSPENRYVGKMRINGQVSQRPFIEYAEIEDGAKILFDMQVRK